MFVTQAFAQGATPATGPTELFIQLVPFALILVIMWFLIIRPQRARAKSHETLVKNLRRGDIVVTTGGIIGKVSKVTSETELEVEIADGVKVKIVRSMVSEVRAKGEPVKE